MDKLTNARKNELLNNSLIGVGTYMGGHFSLSKDSQETIIKKFGFGSSYSEMLKQAQKEAPSTTTSKECDN